MNIEVKNLTKKYGNNSNSITALETTNFRIPSGSFISIVGPSGSGKTTFCNLISCLDIPTSGEVYYDNINVLSLSDKKLSDFRSKTIGFIFQQFNLLPVLTAQENILMPSLLCSKSVDMKYFNQITSILDIKHCLRRLPSELSGGQQQRIAIARSLIMKPRVIFADEPTGNLDSENSKIVTDLLENIWKEMHISLVIITHNPKIAQIAKHQVSIIDGVLGGVYANS